jgi:uncharacterized membrane protein
MELETLKSFFKTTILGGALVVLPIVILLFVFNWLYDFIADKIRPITNIILETARMQEFAAAALALVLILIIFFLVGLIVRTRIGRIVFEFFEKSALIKIPLYKIIKETTLQLMGNNKNLFKYVALVRLFGNDTRITAFVTDEHEDGSYTVFIPSGPAPTAGFIYHVSRNNVQIVNYPVDKAMKTIFSLGSGSTEILKMVKSG